MKYFFIGDIHTRYQLFKKAVTFAIAKGYKIIAVGDYLDCFELDSANDIETVQILRDQYRCLSLAKSLNETGHVALRGNHELSYLDRSMQCPGYQPNQAAAFRVKIQEARLRDYYLIQTDAGSDILVTHAGLSQKFVNQVWGTNHDLIKKIDSAKDDYQHPIYEQGHVDKSNPDPMVVGRKIYGGIFWCRPKEFEPIEEFRQVFGHTKRPSIEVWEGNDSTKPRNINIDNLEYGASQFLLYDKHNDKFEIIEKHEL